mmetsp:Transcript_3571/g.4078  ORF Transcript_3571/g.4078 Transcript_3571/m.4078 type:complete len:325 (-) Transcript_3571:640-1614(-)
MGLAIELDTKDCPIFRAGSNCTSTWWDAVSPDGYNLFYFLGILYAISSVIATIFLCRTRSNDSSSGQKLRVKTLLSCAATGISVVSFVGFGAAIQHPKDSVLGKLSLISLLLMNTFSIQNAQDLLFMYVQSTNNKLLRKGILEVIDVAVLERFLIPYDMWIANSVLTLLIIISPDVFPSDLFIIRFSFGMTAVHIAFLAILLPYYLNKLVDVLNDVLKAEDIKVRIANTESEKWKMLATSSRRLSRYLSVAGPLMSTIHFVAAFSDLLSTLKGYYIFMLFWIGGHFGLVFGQLLVFRSRNERESSRSPYTSYVFTTNTTHGNSL